MLINGNIDKLNTAYAILPFIKANNIKIISFQISKYVDKIVIEIACEQYKPARQFRLLNAVDRAFEWVSSEENSQ